MSSTEAKWLAYKYNLQVLYTKFRYADQLKLIYDVVQESPDNKYKKVSFGALAKGVRPGYIYQVPYFSDFACEFNLFRANWTDQRFKQQMKALIQPIVPLALVPPKYNMLSVALHIRTTGGWDPLGTELLYPHKFPPLDFYIEALARISSIVRFAPMYVYVFTDHSHPYQLVAQLQNNLTEHQMIFDYNERQASDSEEVLKDFFSLAQYPVVVRGESNFSYMATRVGNTYLEIFPAQTSVVNGSVVVGKIGTYMFSGDRGSYTQEVFDLIKLLQYEYSVNE